MLYFLLITLLCAPQIYSKLTNNRLNKSLNEIFISSILDEKKYLTFGTDLRLGLGEFQTKVKISNATDNEEDGVILNVGGYSVCKDDDRAVVCDKDKGIIHSWKIDKRQKGIRFIFHVPRSSNSQIKTNLKCLQRRRNYIVVKSCNPLISSQYFKIKEGPNRRNY